MALYDEVIAVTRPYLGPAAERFVSRQIKGHLKIEETELAAKHLEELAKWCLTSGGLLMDKGKAQELSDKVRTLRR